MPVVALIPVFQALANVRLGRTRLQPHERVGEVVVAIVVLRAKVVALGLAFLPDEGRILGRLMEVVRDRAHVVKELGIDGPPLVLVPQRRSDDSTGSLGDRILQQELLAVMDDEALPFMPDAVLVRGVGRAAEPAFVNSATMRPVRIPVAGSELDPLARVEENSAAPSWGPAAAILGPRRGRLAGGAAWVHR